MKNCIDASYLNIEYAIYRPKKKSNILFVLYKYKDEQPYLWCKG